MPSSARQRGAALAALLVILTLALISAALYATLTPRGRDAQAERLTQAALATAKSALISYAATTDMNQSGPTNLLCPDLDNDGISYSTGSGCGGPTAQSLRLGRLPWRTLGLPDLRDGAGERLWYAVSDNFRSFQPPVTTHSDTSGTLTVRDATGQILFDATTGNGVAAVILAPGTPMARTPAQQRPSHNARDYLDATALEDNADFADNTQNGFINGPVRDANGALLSNDRLIVITRDELLAATEQRIAGEVRKCLIAWASANNDVFPAPAPLDATDYLGTPGTLFGRIPLAQIRNLATDLNTARAQLDSARTQLANRTPATQVAALQAMTRATQSLIQITSQTFKTAQSLKTNPTAAALADSGLDPLAVLLRQRSQALPASANDLLTLLNLTRTPNAALTDALNAQRSATQAALQSDSNDTAAQAAALSAANATLTTLAAQRIDTAAALLQSRSASLVAVAAQANPLLAAPAAQALSANLDTLIAPTAALLAQIQTTRTLAAATFAAANANSPQTAPTAAQTAQAAAQLAQAINAHGDNLAASALNTPAVANAARVAILAQLEPLISALLDTHAKGQSAYTLARSMLSPSNQTNANFNELTTRAALASTQASAVPIEGKSGTIPMLWPEGTPDCRWANPNSSSGWVRNQWHRQLAYQISAPSLTRTATGALAPGLLTVNGRGDYTLVVIAHGRALPTQPRASRADPSQFFEAANAHPSRAAGSPAPTPHFESQPLSDRFNDQLSFQ